MKQATDRAETAVNEGLVSSWSENISVSFCLRETGYGSTLWWMVFLYGAQYKCLSYSYS